MDAFMGYHHIRMVHEEAEKTSFITEYLFYYWKVVSFGLKNVGATYEKMVNSIFAQQIGRHMEIYVDDILAKRNSRVEHIDNLKETLEQLRTYKPWINLEKCSFGVISGKILGYMINEWGIEPNPDKVKALVEEKALLAWCMELKQCYPQKSAYESICSLGVKKKRTQQATPSTLLMNSGIKPFSKSSHRLCKNKLIPKWGGSYRIIHIRGSGTYILEEMKRELVPRTWHVLKLRKYYI
ncbi:hypothetical protein LIER_27993 [Lithospermum erythrorhizon]|uniref:Reverse transcriptase domain-containing protein n=1 Tax=Lithospermum erythrorhizon TaxID=34254 RepID=A0AAV3RHQ0_LITER